MSFQKISILGSIGKNAEVKTINQKQYLTFSVAVSDGKDAQGQPQSLWFDVMYAFNAQTQSWLTTRLLGKSKVFVEGRVSCNAYVSQKTNTAVGSMTIWASMVEPIGMVEKPQQQQQGQAQGGYQQQQAQFAQPPFPPQGVQQPQWGGAPMQGGYPQQGGYAPQGGQGGYQQQQAPMPQAQNANDSDAPF